MSNLNGAGNPMLNLIGDTSGPVSSNQTKAPVDRNETPHRVSEKHKENLGQNCLDARFNSIWNMAWRGQQQPEDLSFGEKSCFLYAVLLSKMYYAKLLTMEEGMEHKEYLRNFFMYYHEQEEAMLKCGTALKLLSNSTDPNVQKVVKEVHQIFIDDRLPWCG